MGIEKPIGRSHSEGEPLIFFLSDLTFVMMFKSFVPLQWDHSVSGGGSLNSSRIVLKGSVANHNARVVLSVMLRHSTWSDNQDRESAALLGLGSFPGL